MTQPKRIPEATVTAHNLRVAATGDRSYALARAVRAPLPKNLMPGTGRVPQGNGKGGMYSLMIGGMRW